MADFFEYNPAKSAWNLENRGFDFDHAGHLTVIYTWRGGRRRIISARPARRSERHAYDTQEP